MTNTTRDIMDSYYWDNEEIHMLETVGYEGIVEKFRNITDKQFNAICRYFDGWLDGTTKKDRLNYWLKQTNLTVAEVNIWMTV